MKQIRWFLSLLVVCGALLQGCTSAPSERQAELLIDQRIQEDAGGNIRLVSFSKTDGQMQDVSSEKVYTLDFSSKIEFMQDCMWGPVFGNRWQGRFLAIPGIATGIMSQFGNMDKQPGRKGQKVEVKGKIVFHKTERGWQGEIYNEGTVN